MKLKKKKTISMHSQDILLEYDKCIAMDFNTNFLVTILGNTLHWGKYIDARREGKKEEEE
jgi:hypothetical protein